MSSAPPIPPPAPPTVTVVGHGRVSLTPDIALVRLGFEVVEDDPAAAMAACGRAADSVVVGLRDAGVVPADLQTTGLSLQVAWEHGPRGQRQVGYQVTSGLTVRVRDVASAGQLASDALAAGGAATRINGFQLAVDDARGAEHDARADAVADARAKATQYAGLTEQRLGDVVTITDGEAGGPVVHPMRMAAAAARPAAMPVEPGETEVHASVTVTWELVGSNRDGVGARP